MIIYLSQLPNNVKWHMIGHLQTNKVKLIAPFIYMIQSVDSIKILKQINKYAEKNKRIINCLIQVKVSTDLNKYGFSVNDFNLFVKSDFKKEFPFVNFRGLMCISSLTSDKQKIRNQASGLVNDGLLGADGLVESAHGKSQASMKRSATDA